MDPTIESNLASQFSALWIEGQNRPDVSDFLNRYPQATTKQRTDVLLVDLQKHWNVGTQKSVEEYCLEFSDIGNDVDLKQLLVVEECWCRMKRGESLDLDGVAIRFPEIQKNEMQKRLSLRVGGDHTLKPQQNDSGQSNLSEPSHETFENAPTGEWQADADRDPSTEETKKGGRFGILQGQGPGIDQSQIDTHGKVGSDRQTGVVRESIPNIDGYDVLEYIARGGMGFVVKARHQVLDRLVAIKMPLARYVDDDDARERFMREARAAAGLQHPQICPIFEVGQAENRPFIIMGYLEGRTLNQWTEQKQPTARESAEMIARVADAVQYAHEHEVLHRDIKPDNVMVQNSDGRPVLMDFGLAKELTDESSRLTQDGQVMGTPAFMAPEQASGQIEQIGRGTDVYALGALLYYLLCKRPPFEGNVGEVLHQVQMEEPERPRAIAPKTHFDLETICLKAMAKSPPDRYASAGELAADLDRFNAGEAISARRDGVVRKLVRTVRRRPVVSAIVIGAAILFSVGGSFAHLANLDRVESSRDRKIANLLSQFDTGLDKQDWTGAHLVEMEGMVADLQSLSAEQGSDAKVRLSERFVLEIKDAINYPRLDQERIASISSNLDLLEIRNPTRAEELQQSLGQRLARWNSVFELKAPFEDLSDLFRDGRIKVGDETLTFEVPNNETPSLYSKMTSEGRVELSATFDSLWIDSSKIGLLLNSVRGLEGYSFALRLPLNKELPVNLRTSDEEFPKTFRAARELDFPFIADLTRNGVSIQRWDVSSVAGKAEQLHLRARREGNQLSIWIGNRAALVFEDLFPLSPTQAGTFGLIWPKSVGLLGLIVSRKFVGVNASGLEVADDLFAQEKFSEAMLSYQKLISTTAEDKVRREADFKFALCLLESSINRPEEAEEIFTNIMTSSDPRWAPLAACQLWLQKLRQGDSESADLIYEFLSADNNFLNVSASLPRVVRDQITKAYQIEVTSPSGLLQSNPNRLAHARQYVEIMQMLNPDGRGGPHAEMGYVNALRLEGLRDEALETSREFAERSQNLACLCMYTDILCVEGRAEFALQEFDRVITQYAAKKPEVKYGVHKDRAEILAALGRWEEVKIELAKVLKPSSNDPSVEITNATIMLMHGFALAHLEGIESAKAWWKKSCQRVRENIKQLPLGRKVNVHRDFLLLAALAEDLQATDIEEFTKGMGSSPLVSMGMQLMDSNRITQIYQRAWNTPRGIQLAENLAIDLVPIQDSIRHPIVMGAYGLLYFDAMGGQVSQEQDQALWDFTNVLVGDLLDGKRLTSTQGMLMAATWRYQSGFLGWQTLAPHLDPQLRGSVAYFAGHRYAAKHREQAIKFWETTINDVPEESLLSKMAAKDIELSESNRGLVKFTSQSGTPVTVTIRQKNDLISTHLVGKKGAENGAVEVELEPGNYSLELGEQNISSQISLTKLRIATLRRVDVAIENIGDSAVEQ